MGPDSEEAEAFSVYGGVSRVDYGHGGEEGEQIAGEEIGYSEVEKRKSVGA